MEKIIPLISSGTEGPLGLKHLPRLWLKTLLSATGRLPDGYKVVRPGFDFIVLEGLGIDPDSALNFIQENLPTYPSFERWICDQPGVNVSPENIAKINDVLKGKTKAPDVRAQILEESGLSNDVQIDDSVMLNNLDDWKAVHAQVAD